MKVGGGGEGGGGADRLVIQYWKECENIFFSVTFKHFQKKWREGGGGDVQPLPPREPCVIQQQLLKLGCHLGLYGKFTFNKLPSASLSFKQSLQAVLTVPCFSVIRYIN